jgi:2-amino-4-hydroxy-6-hydroxymethyldihydropteridine diphosphokinase
MARTSYAIALGSNRRHGAHGDPGKVLRAAVDAIAALGSVGAVSRIRRTDALGPAGRGFANAALIVDSDLSPPELLQALKAIEARFGRRPGRQWGPRVLDLDLLLWSAGAWSSAGLTIPHPQMRLRSFVLDPLAEIASGWRDPLTGATMRQLRARLLAPRPVDRAPTRS